MLGEMIKAARRERNYTQDEFAAKLGINRATLSKYESNIIEPSSSMLILISKELNIPVSFLFGESTTQTLSFDFQHEILSTIQERLSFLLDEADPEDCYAFFHTYNPYEAYDDIFNPKLPISLERIDQIADVIGTTREYLLGVIDDPSGSLESVSNHSLLWKMIDAFSTLNDSGQEKAVERVQELAEISRFNKKSPQAEEDPSEA